MRERGSRCRLISPSPAPRERVPSAARSGEGDAASAWKEWQIPRQAGADCKAKEDRGLDAAKADEEAWASLGSGASRPFPKPKSGRIAVKVINHLGDEVMKVLSVL